MQNFYVDLAEPMPEEIVLALGEVTVLAGRLEHMVLLAIKRKRGIKLVDAQRMYENYTLGAKVFGKKPCKNTGEACFNFGSEPGLREIVSGNKELESLCTEIQNITSKRNSLMHGLFTRVVDRDVIFHKSKIYVSTKQDLVDLKNQIIDLILRLNKLIPVPGVSAAITSPVDLSLSYDASKMDKDDPIVDIVKYVSNDD